MIEDILQPPFKAIFGSVFGDENDLPPNWNDVIFYSKKLRDSDGVSFVGMFPNVTMTLGPTCPFLGVGTFVNGGSYDLSVLTQNIDSQFFIVRTTTYYRILVYNTPQDVSNIIRIESYLRSDPGTTIFNSSEVIFGADTSVICGVEKQISIPDNTLYVLAMGQSNMLGRVNASIVPKTVNPMVQIANTTSGIFESWDLSLDPPQHNLAIDPGVGSAPYANGNTPAYYFAKKIAETYNITVKVLYVARGGVAVSNWKSSAPTGALWREFLNQMTEFSVYVPRLDVVLWLQGESDAALESTTYAQDLTTLIAAVRSNAKVPDTIPWILGKIWDKPSYDTINLDLISVSSADEDVYLTDTFDLTADDNTFVHFSAYSDTQIGQSKWFVAFTQAKKEIELNSI